MTIGIARAVRVAVMFGVAALLYLVIAFWHPFGAAAATISVTTSTDDTTPNNGHRLAARGDRGYQPIPAR